MKTADSLHDVSPLYAPCRTLAFDAPTRWLRKGWQDYQRAPMHSLTYGGVFTFIGWLLIYSFFMDQSYFLAGFLISLLVIGPALAFGLYDISQQLEQGLEPSFRHERSKALHEMGHELMLALLMSTIFLLLLVIISMVMDGFATVFSQANATVALPMSDTTFISVAVVFGGLLFCVSSFALPMIVDRNANAYTAILTSVHAVWCNKRVFGIWSLRVLGLVAAGIVTALAGFMVIVPVLGYAIWHAYRETIEK